MCSLYIIAPPSAPTNLDCTDVTSDSITFVWDAPVDNGGDALAYYEVTRTPGDTVIVTTSTSIMETGLVARSNYTFSIKANNSVGYSDSQSVVCRTNGEGEMIDIKLIEVWKVEVYILVYTFTIMTF